MKQRKWHSGPPPHVGWWNASAARDRRNWRWWDGELWSAPVHEGSDRVWAAEKVQYKSHAGQTLIEWTDCWPKNARVPRIDPRQKDRS